MHRFCLLYILNEVYYHYSCLTQTEAQELLIILPRINGATPLGIYDAKTELFCWEPVQQQVYNEAAISDQGQLATQVIEIAQSLCHEPKRAFEA